MKSNLITSLASMLTVGLMITNSAQALTPQTQFFTATDPSYGNYPQPIIGLGSFTYDLDKVTGNGTEWLGVTDGRLLSFSLEVFGQTFDASDDVEYPFFPLVRLTDGTPDHINFYISDSNVRNQTTINNGKFSSLYVEGDLVPNGVGGYNVGMNVVPEPTTFALFSIGVGALLISKPRRHDCVAGARRDSL